ncbi:MAG: hypothetical protein ACRBG0_07790 [Lewinella sp.]|uniref:hypothetical protein n=1 Tax=Lewinella sp. TaxID=2004506 RepID=UPI003D6BF02C
MDDLEKEYQENFRDQEMPNDDFDVDGLWADIHADLDAQAQTPIRSFYPPKGSMAILLLLTLVGMLWWYSSSDSADSETFSNQTSTSFDEIDNNSLHPEQATPTDNYSALVEQQEKTLTVDALSGNQTIKQETVSINEGTEQEILQRSKSKQEQTPPIVIVSTGIKENTQNALPQLVLTTSLEEQVKEAKEFNEEVDLIPADDDKLNSATATSQSLQSTNEELVLDVQNNNRTDEVAVSSLRTAVPLLAKLPLLPLSFGNSTTGKMENAVTNKPLGLAKRIKNTHWAVAAYSGVNQFRAKYLPINNLEAIALRNNNLSPVWGATYGVNISRLRKNWHLRTGIARYDLWNRLDYQSIDTDSVPIEQVLLRVLINGNTGDVLATEVGDTVGLEITTLQVTHFNRFQTYSIPLEIGWHQRKRAWQYGITAGVVFNFTQQSDGRNFDAEGNLIDYSATDASVLLRPLSIGWSLSPSLAYQLSPRFQLQFQPRWTWSQHRLEEGTVRVQQYNFNLGLQYRF